MLQCLSIENYALIEKIEIQLDKGFTVITGETGAGKSILLGALSMLLGDRADSQVLLDKEKKCIIEGNFEIGNYQLEQFFQDNDLDYDTNLVIRREINQQGKSRGFINDTPVNIGILKDLGDKLIDIHSQHETLNIRNANFQIEIIDSFCKNQENLIKYRNFYSQWNKINSQIENLLKEQEKIKNEQDYISFQYQEIEKLNLKKGEFIELEEEFKVLTHAEEIKSTLTKVSYLLNDNEINAYNLLTEVNNSFAKISEFHPTLISIFERLKSVQIEINDINREIDKYNENVVYDNERLTLISNRIDTVNRLVNKHHLSNADELIDLKQELYVKLDNINNFDEKVATLQKQSEELKKELIKIADIISKQRKQAIPNIENTITETLKQLAMPNAQFKVEHSIENTFTNNGIDKIKFVFTANKGSELKEISKVASGGELSRVMLSLKSLLSVNSVLPTIIFDEIDQGVSGETADKMGNILKKMSNVMQVIAITHLPQIAGKGNGHLYVYKDNTQHQTKTIVKKLKQEERIEQIARMMSGEKITESAIQTAKELLQ